MVKPLTVDALQGKSDDDLPNDLWEYYLKLSEEAEKSSERSRGHSLGDHGLRLFAQSLPRGLRYVVRYFCFDGDVLNGGLSQFFFNHTPVEVCETLDVLQDIGARQSVRILNDAISVYCKKYGWPRMSNERWLVDTCEDEDVERLSGKRCNNESSIRDYAILAKYLRQRLDECIVPAKSKR